MYNITNTDRTLQRDEIIARPKFNGFQKVSAGILKTILSSEKTPVEAPLHPIYENYTKMLPIGFDLSSDPHIIEDLNYLRFRKDDKLNLILGSEKNREITKSDSSNSVSSLGDIGCLVEYIYFPLVSVLVPKWLTRSRRDKTRRIIYLITGRASPTKKQTNDGDQMINENSTDETGRLIKAFIETYYENCEVRCVHSSTNLFRYDEVKESYIHIYTCIYTYILLMIYT